MIKRGAFFVRTTFMSFAAIVVFGTAVTASAQMTIFNVPSTDVLERGSTALEFDVITKPAALRDGGFQSYGYRIVYGLTNNLEIGTNFFYTRDGSGSVGDLQFNVKRKLYESEKHAVAVSAGAQVFIPIKDSSTKRAPVMLYSTASKVIKPLNGLRLTGGAYTILNGGADFGTKTGAIVGIEQPISKRFSFLGDWYSGSNKLGYAAAGLNYNITPRQFITAGYNFGNTGRGNNAFSAFYGYTF